ncbi:hypothetical protein DFQ01_11816 [Paenibacillus cellulosilyticus]|uniref:Uncharacterized protein n=1 Tax=Paenibacillus cellulosilyticus TaxID=375489 RepID=A0A2V2YYJ2_9BACL|nr:hypothetical protein [Paenibacillus cellulosilyticus]PWV98382.1 hypothetical protein DFQ01_11816 [Paenibacillus cellulosilyticus]QKS43233.1 hypothetical protein HUB94_01800 [Paenibacillus cellulosilyticus]
MNRTSTVVRMHLRKKLNWLLVPVAVLLSSFIINVLIGAFTDDPIYTGGLSSIFVYMMVMGIITFAQTFPFALGMGIRRLDYYRGTFATGLLTVLVFAVFLFLMSMTEGKWTNYWGVRLHFFELPYWSDGPIINRLWIPFVLLLNMFAAGILIGTYYRRFNKTGLLIGALAIVLLGTIASFVIGLNDYWTNIFNWLQDQTMTGLALWTLPITLLFSAVSYLLLRRCT